tara:strand:+ start:6015 stop:6920 length:906 start_codon:yes stop_codon:yes gene_type:complete
MENRYSANRFIFTENTTRRIAEILAECPTLILNSIQFARFPYEHTYIEYPGWVFSDNVNKNELWYKPQNETLRCNVGFMQKGNLFAVTLGREEGTVICPKLYALNDEVPNPMFYQKFESGGQDNKILFGSSYKLMDNNLKFASLADIYIEKTNPKIANQFVIKNVSEFRDMMSLLLWINQPKYVDYIYVPVSHKMVGNKRVSYAAHHLVKLKDEMMKTKRLSAALRQIVSLEARNAPRRHQVRGFWRHYHRNKACVHIWPFDSDDRGNWKCTKCDTLRVWINSFERGDAGIGYVTKEYVTY